MTTFTIDTDNNITAHATPEEAAGGLGRAQPRGPGAWLALRGLAPPAAMTTPGRLALGACDVGRARYAAASDRRSQQPRSVAGAPLQTRSDTRSSCASPSPMARSSKRRPNGPRREIRKRAELRDSDA